MSGTQRRRTRIRLNTIGNKCQDAHGKKGRGKGYWTAAVVHSRANFRTTGERPKLDIKVAFPLLYVGCF